MHQNRARGSSPGCSGGFMPDLGGRGCLLMRKRDRDRSAVALELEITQDLYARGARGARGAMCRDSMDQNRR